MNNTLYESDFKDNLKLIGNYFKYLFINDITLDPTIAKSIFKNKFHNIDIRRNDTNTYIISKYRETKNINRDKIDNTVKIFT